MRAQGYNDPASPPETQNPFLRGEGSWWSRWYISGGTSRSYVVTASWARAQVLYDHLRDYGLVQDVPHSERPQVGDVIFYSVPTGNTHMDHSQVVVRVTKGVVYVAQHSQAYVKPLKQSKHNMDVAHPGGQGTAWNYYVLRPKYAVANIG
jgi:hypothetical protein